MDPTSIIPMVGASGPVGSVVGRRFVLYPPVKVHNLVVSGFYVTTVALPGQTTSTARYCVFGPRLDALRSAVDLALAALRGMRRTLSRPRLKLSTGLALSPSQAANRRIGD